MNSRAAVATSGQHFAGIILSLSERRGDNSEPDHLFGHVRRAAQMSRSFEGKLLVFSGLPNCQ